MFRTDDLIEVLRIECALGGRRYGHFDHDAANITGPRDYLSQPEVALPVMESGLGVSKDPATGEYLSTY